MTERRAFRVSKEGVEAGLLGEGPGPIIFASESGTGFPVLAHVRFTATNALLEDDVGRILETETHFELVLSRLTEEAFMLEPIRYDDAFEPANQSPIAGPSVAPDLARLLGEDP